MFHPQSSQVIHPQLSQVIHPQSSQASIVTLQSPADLLQVDSCLVVPYFLSTDDPLECLNKVMAFMCTTLASSYLLTNNQLDTLSNPMNQCTQPTKVQNSAWFKEKMLLAQVQEARIALNGIDLYDSNCDDISTAKAVLMANLLSYSSDVLSEPSLYDGSVISSQHAVIPVIDDKETLILEEVKLSAVQAFWLQTSHPNTDKSATSPVKIEAPRELPKVILVNTSLKKLKYHLGKFDTTLKKRITPDVITEGEWGFEHTKKCFVDKKLFEIEKKELKLDNERLLEHIICQDVVNIVMCADDKSVNALPVQNTFLDDNIALDVLKMENDRKSDCPTVLKLDLEPVTSKLKNYREAHVDYIRITKENVNTLRDIVEQARISNPLDNALAYACMYTKQIQELLVYVSDTCPSSPSRMSNPPNGSNDDITNPYECDQTLNVSAGTLNLSAGPAPHRKEKCTLQCALSLKEEKSSYLRAVLSTTSISSHARSVNKWINVH
ncbi:hypothetical protein Tco_0699389 [Tanacetum coccineum]